MCAVCLPRRTSREAMIMIHEGTAPITSANMTCTYATRHSWRMRHCAHHIRTNTAHVAWVGFVCAWRDPRRIDLDRKQIEFNLHRHMCFASGVVRMETQFGVACWEPRAVRIVSQPCTPHIHVCAHVTFHAAKTRLPHEDTVMSEGLLRDVSLAQCPRNQLGIQLRCVLCVCPDELVGRG